MSWEGEPSGARNGQVALIFLHGFALDARMWSKQVEDFSRDHRVITVDLPGFGPQARDVGEVDPAVGIRHALDRARVERAHFVASCYGAAVAVDFALQYGERVQSLTLTGPLLLGRRTGIEAWPRCVSLASRGDPATALEIWLDDALFECVREDDDRFEDVRRIVLDYACGHWTGKVSMRWSDPDPLGRFASLRMPSLIISGARDIPGFVNMADTYAESLPRAHRETLASSGHLPNIEQPELFNALLRAFLDEC